MLTKMNDICLFVDDFESSLKFYKEVFGFKVKRLQPDEKNANYAEFEFQGSGVTLWSKKGVCEVLGDKCLGPYGHHFMIAIKVPTLKDVDDIHAELVSRGAECIKDPNTFIFGARAAYFNDFEGNVWEVFAWKEGDGPGLI